VPTWIVIHGRNSAPTTSYITQIATALEAETTGDQVLLLDWNVPAYGGLFGGGGENYIKPIAAWMRSTLVTSNLFAASQLNFAGHSWGAYIASETAELVGQVNSIIALDPATDFPGGSYNPEKTGEVNFAANTRMSWAFYDADGDIYGSSKTAVTADETFTLKSTNHSKLVEVVADLIALDSLTNPLAALFDLGRLLDPPNNPPAPWSPNRYSASGALVATGGLYEAVIYTTNSGTKFASVDYVLA
jgi:pimeloyl-ACP methyl ester carboxylesterase